MATYLTPNQQLLVAKIEQKTAETFYIDLDEYAVLFRSTRRDQQISHARHFLWYILHGKLGLPLKLIGNMYGKDHTSVMCGIRGFEKRDADGEYKKIAVNILDDKDIRELRTTLVKPMARYPHIHTSN